MLLHAVALFLGSVGIYAAFKFHNESGIDNLYSLHSWVGLGTICLYGIQVRHTNPFYFCNIVNYKKGRHGAMVKVVSLSH